MDPCKYCITKPAEVGKKKPKCLKKQNLLVYDKSFPCVDKSQLPRTCYEITPLQRAKVKKIRVCTGADLKRMCPPKLCACSTKNGRSGIAASIAKLLGFGVKGALAGGLIYWTYGIGLWGKPDETERIYVDLCKFAFKPNQDEMDRLIKMAREERATLEAPSCDAFARRSWQMAQDERESAQPLDEDAIMAKMDFCQHAPSIRDTTNSFKNWWNHKITCAFTCASNISQRLSFKKEEVADDNDEGEKKE